MAIISTQHYPYFGLSMAYPNFPSILCNCKPEARPHGGNHVLPYKSTIRKLSADLLCPLDPQVKDRKRGASDPEMSRVSRPIAKADLHHLHRHPQKSRGARTTRGLLAWHVAAQICSISESCNRYVNSGNIPKTIVGDLGGVADGLSTRFATLGGGESRGFRFLGPRHALQR